MILNITDINESYIKINFDGMTDPMTAKQMLDKMLAVHVQNYQFSPEYRSGVWDGMKRFYKIVDGEMIIPKGLVTSIVKFLNGNGYEVRYQSSSVYPQITRDELTKYIKTLGLPFELYDFQFNYILESINEGRNIGVSSTSSGKSLMIYVLMRWMRDRGLKAVLIVPNISLVSQIRSDFDSYGMPSDINVHQITAGCPKHFNELMTITTWQSIYKSKELFVDIDCIIVDEVHGAKGDSLQAIMSSAGSTLYKFGVTGTLPKPIAEKMAIVSAFGKSRKVINSMSLIEYGLATPIEIKMIFGKYSKEDKGDLGNCDYIQEKKYIETHINRNKIVAKMANTIAMKTGNTFVMFGTIAHGKFLLSLILAERYKMDYQHIKVVDKITNKTINDIYHDYDYKTSNFFINGEFTDDSKVSIRKFLLSRKKKYIKELKTKPNAMMKTFVETIDDNIDPFIDKFKSLQDEDVYIVYGEIEASQREEIRKILETKENAIVLGSFPTMSTGISVKRLHNVILGASLKSFVTLNQIIGRLMRLYSGKDKATLWDFVDDLSHGNGHENTMLKHSNERIEIYFDNEYPIITSETEIPSDHIAKGDQLIKSWI